MKSNKLLGRIGRNLGKLSATTNRGVISDLGPGVNSFSHEHLKTFKEDKLPSMDEIAKQHVALAEQRINEDSDPKVKMTVTMHPVTNYPKELLKTDGEVYTAKEMWHEIKHSFESYKELLQNFKDKNVVLRSWKHGDRDRHPNEQTGISTLGSIIEKAAILEALNIEINLDLHKNIELCVSELIHRFDTRPKNQSDYHEVVAKYSDSLDELNQLWQDNLGQVREIHAGSDYRVSSSDLKDAESQEKVIQTLVEMRESNADITRLIIADCENATQVEIARRLADNSGLKLEVMPLIEDRVSKDELKNIIEATAKDNSLMNIMIAGSDSDRRIHKVGVTNLVFDIVDGIKEYMENNPGQLEKVNFFTGTGNSVFRTQKLPHYIPTLLVDGKNIIEVEATTQGQSFHALADEVLSQRYLQEHVKGLDNRPTQEDVSQVRGFFAKCDVVQARYLETNGDDPILRTDRTKKILDNGKVFGSRFKDVNFLNETISQYDLLDSTRAIDHAWIWQTTRAVSTGIKEFHHLMSDPELQAEMLDNRDNPYVKKLVQDILQMSCYCDEKIAKKYYCNEATCNEDFAKLQEVTSFIKDNFPVISEEINNTMKNEHKHFDVSNAQFKEYWKEDLQYCEELAELVKKAVDKDQETETSPKKSNSFNRDINHLHINYHNRSPLLKNSGRNYSTQTGLEEPSKKTPDLSFSKATARALETKTNELSA